MQKSSYEACESEEIKRLLELYKRESARLSEPCCISLETEFLPEDKKVVLIKQYGKKEVLPNGQEREIWLPVFGKSTIFKESQLRKLCRLNSSQRDCIPHPITRDPISHVGDKKPAKVTQEGTDFPPDARAEDIELGCVTRYRYHRYQDNDDNALSAKYIYSQELTYLAAQLRNAYQNAPKGESSTTCIFAQLNTDMEVAGPTYHRQMNEGFLGRLEQRQYPSPLAAPSPSSDESSDQENKACQR